jgi:hypothetical protein
VGKQTPLKAIRRECLRCAGANYPWDYVGVPIGLRLFKQVVKDCPEQSCNLWPYREGKLPKP